jgi:PAS domain-containing protein
VTIHRPEPVPHADPFHSFFDLANQGFAITAPDTRWLHVNVSLCRMLGYSEEEFRRLTWVELTHPEDRAPDLDQFRQIMARAIAVVRDGRVERLLGVYVDITAERKAVEQLRAWAGERTNGAITELLTKSGDVRDLSWYDEMLNDPDDGGRLLVAVGVDVTDELAAEQALQRLNEQLGQKVAERTKALEVATAAMI